ncbi:hypothetical protein OG758_00380 [Streptomyces sp. NBC_01474]|uniref:hypothetical protein n=1 Tax=Streptomyces sp. NBC_01474 TaxID=2903880 RepID=UPI002DDA36C9|nr:hypothetical protein [Streptomyces sp. NBC_01474]WSD92821.1 hypothetical protein OG758_00380 [Streptomyces sp. NBC_01474]
MTASAVPSEPPSAPQRRRRAARVVLAHLVRGLAYGAGTAVAGLLAYWAQQYL